MQVYASEEFRRIASLPKRQERDWEEQAKLLTQVLKTPEGTRTLWPIQAQALTEAWENRGLFGGIIVGGGKTDISLLLPYIFDAKRAVLLLPASLVLKTVNEGRRLSKHWRIRMPVIVSYDELGRVKAEKLLESLRPDLIICDEAHRLKSKKAGVTRRVLRYMKNNPDVPVCIMSGTVMKKSLNDFAHIAKMTHKGNSPLPLHEGDLIAWANALDEGVNPIRRTDPGPLVDWCPASESTTKEVYVDELTRARRGFYHRFSSTPGVVCTSTENVACSIYVNAIEYQTNAATETNFEMLRTLWCTPCEYSFGEAAVAWMYARELALGLHYVWWNDRGYKECLTKTLKNNDKMLGLTELKILKNFEHMTESGLPLASARGILRQKNLKDGLGISNEDTALRLKTMIACWHSKTGNALCATKHATVLEDVYTLTTIMQQVGYEVFCATLAIEPWEFLKIAQTSLPELSNILEKAIEAARPPKDWKTARKKWHQFVRGTLSDSRTLDTELQVANAIDKGLLLDDGILAEWRKIKPTYPGEPDFAWHDDAALNVCVEWAKKPGIIWIEHTFFGKELSRRTGLPYFGPKGLDANGRYLQTYSDAIRDGKEKPACILASVAACHYGYNLQPWNRNLVTACPAGAALWEQLLGRTHRMGQLEDEIEVDVLMGCLEHWDAWTKAVAQAKATTELLKQPQKLCVADVLKMPTFLDITARSDYRWKKAVKLSVEQ